MRIMAIDLGDRRVGLAMSDPGGIIAAPLRVLDRKEAGWRELLRTVIGENSVAEIVVGLPKNMDGTIGIQGHRCEKFARELHATTGLKVHLLDERLTSVAASAALREGGKKSKNTKKTLDAVAASLILQMFLERRRNGGD
jgi:putative Holliday junction resolvase